MNGKLLLLQQQKRRCSSVPSGREGAHFGAGLKSPGQNGVASTLYDDDKKRFCKRAMQRPGIEPGSRPWQGRILPLDQRCNMKCHPDISYCPSTDSNREHPARQVSDQWLPVCSGDAVESGGPVKRKRSAACMQRCVALITISCLLSIHSSLILTHPSLSRCRRRRLLLLPLLPLRPLLLAGGRVTSMHSQGETASSHSGAKSFALVLRSVACMPSQTT